MEIKASLNNLRMSPRKARLVLDVVRKMPTDKALGQLMFLNKKATMPVIKLIKSAIANAVNNYDLDKDNLYIKEIKADEGKTLKRWMPKAHGRATVIRKRGCHIDITLAEIKDSGKKAAKKQEVEAPVKLDTLVNVKESADGKKLKADAKNIKKSEEVEKEIVEPHSEGRHAHAKVEGKKGFAGKMFRRKSG
jgi:large subunit ribosomal protein L22